MNILVQVAAVMAIGTGFVTGSGVAITLWGNTQWVTIASTEKALLHEYRKAAADLQWLYDQGQITPRQRNELDNLYIQIEELKEELK